MIIIYCPHCRQNRLMTTTEVSQQAEDQQRIYVQQRRCCQVCGRSYHTIEVHADMVHQCDQLQTFNRLVYQAELCGEEQAKDLLRERLQRMKS